MLHIIFLAVIFVVTGSSNIISAQQPPYDVVPDAEPPFYRVRYEASTVEGELDLAVNYTIWIPPKVETLRGVVVHQHGYDRASLPSHRGRIDRRPK